MNGTEPLATLLAGATTGVILALAIAASRVRLSRGRQWLVWLSGASTAAYAAASVPELGARFPATPFVIVPLVALICGGCGFIASLIRSAFSDQRVQWRAFAPSGLLAILGVSALSFSGLARAVALVAYTVACVWVLASAVVAVLGGLAGDLVEARRRLRQPIVVLVAAAAAGAFLDLAVGSATRAGLLHSWMTVWREAGLAVFAIAAAGLLLELRSRLVTIPAPATPAKPDADAVLLAALHRVMSKEELWRRESLSLHELASAVGAPEHRVRSTILNRLERRNFSAFVNGYRIDAAKVRLQAPRERQGSIAEIAFDVGFSSVSAFNRAFKDAVGETPTAWRARTH